MPIEEEKKTGETVAAPVVSGKKSGIIKWAIVGVILLLFVCIEVGIAIFFVDKLKKPEQADTTNKTEETNEASFKVGATLAAPIEVTVNLKGDDGEYLEGSYLKCGVQLEYDPTNIKLPAELESRKVMIKNIIIDIMSNQPRSVLMTNDGKNTVRKKIVDEVNAILPDTLLNGKKFGRVERSYFDSFMMQ